MLNKVARSLGYLSLFVVFVAFGFFMAKCSSDSGGRVLANGGDYQESANESEFIGDAFTNCRYIGEQHVEYIICEVDEPLLPVQHVVVEGPRTHSVETVTSVTIVEDDDVVVEEEITVDDDEEEDEVVPPVQAKVKKNNGHGNNVDGVDCSNPGKSKKHDLDTDPSVDDEKPKKNK